MLNHYKLIAIGMLIMASTLALLIGRIEFIEWFAVNGPFVGYLVGNGVATRSGLTASPVISPRQKED